MFALMAEPGQLRARFLVPSDPRSCAKSHSVLCSDGAAQPLNCMSPHHQGKNSVSLIINPLNLTFLLVKYVNF